MSASHPHPHGWELPGGKVKKYTPGYNQNFHLFLLLKSWGPSLVVATTCFHPK